MISKTPNRRGDGQLGLMLYETAHWTVTGRQGVKLSEVASLRLAVDKAADLLSVGLDVVALVRRHPAEIVVFSDQIRILADWVSALEMYSVAADAMKA